MALVGVLTAGVVGVGSWIALADRGSPVSGTSGDSHTTHTTPHHTNATANAGSAAAATSPTPPATDGVAACVAELGKGDSVISAAQTGIGHWAEHVQSRTDLLAGRQTKDVTSAIWKRTRLAGPGDLERYDRAVAEYKATTRVCAGTKSAGGEQGRLTTCQERAQVMKRALDAAAAGMTDWRSHQQAMAAHKAGEFDAAHAQDLWVAAWTAAPENIQAFRAVSAQLAAAPACR
ncbi:hypothetical protein ACIBL3_21455 [Kribbella sp. NPDC050124]|uniref:hypothetical protein n=1 Tax=Kribbella sp. NPDC050124 TaxID=3364114 RepID=UPI0037A68CB2